MLKKSDTGISSTKPITIETTNCGFPLQSYVEHLKKKAIKDWFWKESVRKN